MEHVDEVLHREEFRRAAGVSLTVIFSTDAAIIVIAHLLLSLRHPENRGPSSELVVEWVRGIIGKVRENGFPVLAQQSELDLEATLRLRRE